ncbi:665_t:CDS:2 [Acaulospora colombiana]|uniref:665_t:CDS:1 n=1 Tax=Acaulospora colombiana TaxID=27376 RepID=A0ACA9KSG7_9GLOM|nr:665_t:CDS:2 [Acaulospora colombiana]
MNFNEEDWFAYSIRLGFIKEFSYCAFESTRKSSTPSGNHFMVLQYVGEEHLQKYLSTNFKYLSWDTKIAMAKDIAKGLDHIHSSDIVHGNLAEIRQV